LEKAKKSFGTEPGLGQPEGRIQIVVSTHSPNLTAWVSPKHLVVVRSRKENDSAFTQSACVPIARLGMADEVVGKIDRYLDVTRSALLFGNRAALVEGIAEAMLLPLFARLFVLNDDPDAIMRFNGAVLVPIDGVDFRPYVEILLRAYEGVRIADRVVVITDADPSVPGSRKDELDAFAVELNATDKLHVFTNQVTFEHELFTAANKALLKAVFLDLHPRSEARWNDEIEALAESAQPDAFLNLLLTSKTRKGDFAQGIAGRLEAGALFEIPEYLRQAITKIAEAWN
jgi:putative ATP-dependent endonuclease of OLD family